MKKIKHSLTNLRQNNNILGQKKILIGITRYLVNKIWIYLNSFKTYKSKILNDN